MIFNHGAEEIFGYTADEVLDLPLSIILPKYVREKHPSYVKRFDEECSVKKNGASPMSGCFNSRSCIDISGVRKDGTEFPIEVTITKTVFEGKKFFTAIVRDITERKKHIEQIKEQQDELAQYRKTVKQRLLKEVSAIAETKTVLYARQR